MSTNIAPVEDRILVKLDPHAESYVNGLIIPGTVQRATHALVVAAGPGKFNAACVEGREPMPCATGDYVMLQSDAGCELGFSDLRIIAPRDVLAVVTPDAA